jgi:hypothetical protein
MRWHGTAWDLLRKVHQRTKHTSHFVVKVPDVAHRFLGLGQVVVVISKHAAACSDEDFHTLDVITGSFRSNQPRHPKTHMIFKKLRGFVFCMIYDRPASGQLPI